MKNAVMDRIYHKAPLQKKKIDKFFSECPSAEAELVKFLDMYKQFMENEGLTVDDIVDSYLGMIDQFIYARLEFIRTGCYPVINQEAVLNEVYTNKNTMQQSMLGLALSYFLWRHHFQLLEFYRDCIKKMANGKSLLEVGCGHGLLLAELLNNIVHRSNIEVVDISLHSIVMTKKLLETILPDLAGDIVYHHCDIFKFETNQAYDFITVGEVLEHVDDPLMLLSKLAEYLAPDGHIFITTCANCPAIDHVYHFKNIQEIKDMIKDAGLIVENEIIAPSERRNVQDLEKFQIDISYAATLKKVI